VNITARTDAHAFHRLDDERDKVRFFSGPHGSALPSCETSHGRIAPIDSFGQDPLTMIPRFLVAALCVLGPLTCVAHGGNINGEATYISFTVPGALGTYPMSINASMTVTGYYYVTPTVARGFLREADGTITTFDVAGATVTQPEGINTAGNITGYYIKPGVYAARGFLRYADGRIITFEANQTIPFLGLVPWCMGSPPRPQRPMTIGSVIE